MSRFTDKQEAFCREYLVDFNATRAAVRAGYSSRSAGQIGGRLMTKESIRLRLDALRRQRNERLRIDAEYVLRQAVKLHERCMQEVKVKKKGSDKVGHNEAVFEFNAAGAAKALELVGKHVAVGAFRENLKHSGGITITWKEEKTYETKPKADTGH